MKFVILGNGIAGLTAAITIRELDQESEIIMVSEEATLSYNRPMLTKASLKGFDSSQFMIKSNAWYQEHQIKPLIHKQVIAIHPKQKEIVLNDGTQLSYDKCIYALGAKSFIPPIPGIDQSGVLTIRKLEDLAALRTQSLIVKTAVVIGGGVIGLEVAWELKKVGLQVTVLEQAPHLMGAMLDHQSAKILEEQVKIAGIQVQTRVNITKISHKKTVMLADGTEYPADLVILSCGIRANTELALKAGIEVNRGVVVNEYMETNIKDIYACGDCTEFEGANDGLWEEAINQGQVAGANSCGEKREYQKSDKTLLFNGMETSVFAIGDLTGDDYQISKTQNPKPTHFMINNPLVATYSYQKYFYKDKSLVGAVLIGDLRPMVQLKQAIKKNVRWKNDSKKKY